MTDALKFRIRDIAARAGKTFVQAFVSTFAAGFATDLSWPALKALVVASGAAALSAAWNTVRKPSPLLVLEVVEVPSKQT